MASSSSFSSVAFLTACLIVLFVNQLNTAEADKMENINNLCIDMGTTDEDLCVEFLKSDPRSFTAPWGLLPNVSIDILKTNATAIQRTLKTRRNKALEFCVMRFDEAIQHFISGMRLYKSPMDPFDGTVSGQLNFASANVVSCVVNLNKKGHAKVDLVRKIELLIKLIGLSKEILSNIQV